MELQIESLHFDADQKLQDLIQKKTASFEKIFKKIERCSVTLKLDKDKKKQNKIVEVNVHVPHKQLFAIDRAGSFESATDLVIDEMKQQLKKYKEKLPL